MDSNGDRGIHNSDIHNSDSSHNNTHINLITFLSLLSIIIALSLITSTLVYGYYSCSKTDGYKKNRTVSVKIVEQGGGDFVHTAVTSH